jgi:murein DD-endopeptidase MepM/ murein hydrolase activator NlpD
MTIQTRSAYGLARVTVSLDQGKARCPVLDRQTGLSRWGFWRRKEAADRISFTVLHGACPTVKEGAAAVTVVVKSADMRGRTDSITQPVRIVPKPATLHAGFEPHYTIHGGPAAVKYTIAGDWVETGVRVSQYRFRAFPLSGGTLNPGDEAALVSFFAVPWDADPDEPVAIYIKASDGRELTATIRMVIERRKFRDRNVKIDDKFLRRVVGDVLGGNDGADPLVKFKRINSDRRTADTRRLAALAAKTAPAVLWSGPFQQLPKSKVEGQFADNRHYLYAGALVDSQRHLGIDLASTRNSPVPAANSGRVLFAERIGIYGNCVLIDHGLGVQTVYAHLSRIDVLAGADVAKGQIIGLTGMTGLAGGDHLHFGMMIDGVETNPVRFFERNWIVRNIATTVPVGGLEKAGTGRRRR